MATKEKTTKTKSAAVKQKAKVQYPEKFTSTAIANFLAEKHELSKKQRRQYWKTSMT
jgi:hypothetical protein